MFGAVLLTGFVLGFPLMTNESRSRWFEDLSVMRKVFAGQLMRCGVARENLTRAAYRGLKTMIVRQRQGTMQ
jgi:hypothetical protein